MGGSGSKRGHANLIVTIAEAEVFDVLVRNEPAFDVSRCVITYRPRQEEGDALREALMGSGSLSAHAEGADEIVIPVLVGKAYGDLIGGHERSVEMVTFFIFGTVLKNASKMVDVEFLCHWGIRRQLCEWGAQSDKPPLNGPVSTLGHWLVERAARLLRAHQVHVDVARAFHRLA